MKKTLKAKIDYKIRKQGTFRKFPPSQVSPFALSLYSVVNLPRPFVYIATLSLSLCLWLAYAM